ncbi:MAG TPA: hypothetical protein VMJ93_10625 [Verrucomicrobiae bacterium]|nr:hypothetical protein [Verrucomicrobiae bacterium]
MKKFALALGLCLLLPAVLAAVKNLGDYPLKIQVVESHWTRHKDGSVSGWGRGDITDGDSIHAFDFTYESSTTLLRTIGNAHYAAKWKKEPVKLELLAGEIGSPDKYYTFTLKTTVREDVYMPSPSGAVAVSQEEYKAKQQK